MILLWRIKILKGSKYSRRNIGLPMKNFTMTLTPITDFPNVQVLNISLVSPRLITNYNHQSFGGHICSTWCFLAGLHYFSRDCICSTSCGFMIMSFEITILKGSKYSCQNVGLPNKKLIMTLTPTSNCPNVRVLNLSSVSARSTTKVLVAIFVQPDHLNLVYPIFLVTAFSPEAL